jgi:hypothetical protein
MTVLQAKPILQWLRFGELKGVQRRRFWRGVVRGSDWTIRRHQRLGALHFIGVGAFCATPGNVAA